MIAPSLLALYGQRIPFNVCRHCGEADDPESAKKWPEDDDGDRICWGCEAELKKALNAGA